jgi:hypothetical protein
MALEALTLDVVVAALTSLLVFAIRERITTAGKMDVEQYKDELKRYTDTQLEVLKNELKRDADAELEREKSRLRVFAESQLYRVGRITEKRVATFAEMYVSLAWMSQEVERYVNPLRVSTVAEQEADKTLLGDLQTAYRAYRKAALENRIFLSRRLRDRLDDIGDRVERMLWSHLSRDGSSQEARAEWIALHAQAKALAEEVSGKVASDFATLIGAEDDATAHA